jgi:hypothetical protein
MKDLRSTLQVLAALLVLTLPSTAVAIAQPLGPVPELQPSEAEQKLRDFLDGDPASKTKTVLCQPTGTGAKQEHVGRPPVVIGSTENPTLGPGEFRPQVFVVCSKGIPRIFFVPSTDADRAFATQALSIIGAAHLSSKPLSIVFDPADRSGETIGCHPAICKRILAITMREASVPAGPGN